MAKTKNQNEKKSQKYRKQSENRDSVQRKKKRGNDLHANSRNHALFVCTNFSIDMQTDTSNL